MSRSESLLVVLIFLSVLFLGCPQVKPESTEDGIQAAPTSVDVLKSFQSLREFHEPWPEFAIPTKSKMSKSYWEWIETTIYNGTEIKKERIPTSILNVSVRDQDMYFIYAAKWDVQPPGKTAIMRMLGVPEQEPQQIILAYVAWFEEHDSAQAHEYVPGGLEKLKQLVGQHLASLQ